MSEWEKELQTKLDSEKAEFPDAWKPEVGDSLLGTITGIREPTTQFGTRKVWEIQGIWTHSKTEKIDPREEGTWSLWESTVLRKLTSAPLGAHVGIKYLGVTKGEKGREYKNYKIEILPP